MRVLDSAIVKKLIRMCDDGWKQGWHECHGGNLSCRLTAEERQEIKPELSFDGAWRDIGLCLPGIAGEWFLVTASGQIFRNTMDEPEKSLGIIEIAENGEQYRILWGYAGGGKPTSELPAHLANQEAIARRTGGRYRIVYHAHPENIIALSFVLPLTDEVFTRELWEMMPECAMTFPSGMGVVPWMVPGTNDIARITMQKIGMYDIVLWAQHGVFAVGADPDSVFGLVHTVEKSAEILMKVLAVRPDKRQTPTAQDLRDMAKVFNLDLPERFLYEKDQLTRE